MKALRAFLSRRSRKQPAKGTLGKESGWLSLGNIELSSTKFLIADFQFIPSADDGVLVKSTPGKYKVEAKGIAFGGDRRISRLRVFKKGFTPTLGKKVGETWTDTALAAVCDFKALTEECDRLGDDAASDKIQEAYEDADDCGVFKLSRSGSPVFYVASGFGDGTFPVFELREGSAKVGFEVEFIAPEAPYPFAPTPKPAPLSLEEKESCKHREKKWAEFGKMLKSVKAKRTGDKQDDRKTLGRAFAGFLKGMEDEVRSMLPELRKQMLAPRHRALPLCYELNNVPRGDWLEEDGMKARALWLEQAGFRHFECYQSNVAATVLKSVYTNPSQKSFGSVTRMPQAASPSGFGAILAIDYYYSDGTELVFTEQAIPAAHRRPPWLRVFSYPQLPTAELIRLAEETHSQKGLIAAIGEDFKRLEADSWRRTTAWLAATGGQSAAYFKEVLHLSDSPEDMEKLEQVRRGEVDKSLCNWLRLQPRLPFDVEAVLDSLVIIHDELSSDMLAACWWCATEDVSVRDREFKGGSPRQAFAAVNAKRGNKLRLVLQKTADYQADFYLPNQPQT